MLCTGGGAGRMLKESTQFNSTQADKFWGKSDIVKCIAEIGDAHKKQNECIQRTDDLPSFSLGLTQSIEADHQEANEIGNDEPTVDPTENVMNINDGLNKLK